MNTSLTPLTQDNLGQAALALASAFSDDPLIRYLIPDEAMRLRCLPDIMRANLRLVLPEGESWALSGDGGEVIGAIGVTPPGRYPVPLARNLSFIWELLRRPTLWEPPLFRMLRGVRYMRQWERLHYKGPHWYVFIVGVHGSRHGLGHGRALLEKITSRARGENQPVYLETQTESNVRFYRSAGFEVTEKIKVYEDGPPIWGLLKKP